MSHWLAWKEKERQEREAEQRKREREEKDVTWRRLERERLLKAYLESIRRLTEGKAR